MPLKTIKVSSDDQPWVSQKVKKLDRLQKREYSKHKKSQKWGNLNKCYEDTCTEEKEKYYANIVEDLKVSEPGQWYSKLKRMSGHDQMKNKEVQVLDLIGKTVDE